VIECRKERSIVESERAFFEIVLAGFCRSRAARFEDDLRVNRIERGERCVFERRRRDSRYLVPLLGKLGFVESKTARKRRIRRIVANLVCEDVAREMAELVLC